MAPNIMCMKCKSKTQNMDEKVVTSNGRSRMTATCACGTKKSVFMPKQKGEGATELKATKASYEKNTPESIDGYVLDKSLSKNKIKTYVHPETKKVIIAHKGTDPKDKNDLKNDLLLSAGLLNKHTSKRVKNANEITKKANAKYGAQNVTHTGHSLGGYMADNSATKDNKVETYNRGTSPLDIALNKAKKKNPNAIHYTTGVDPISASQLSSKDKVVTVKPTKLNVHGLDNFEGLHKQEGEGKRKRGRPKKIIV